MPAIHHQNPQPPVSLSFEAVDDLIYDARVGDLEALKTHIADFSREHNCSASAIVRSAIDTEDESEGGTGNCLLHWPAANGNVEILTYLLQILASEDGQVAPEMINYRNNSGNTPLHWAALNTHLDCVKALVEAGADIGIKNDAGHDAVFLAERAAWSSEEEGDGKNEGEEGEGKDGEEGGVGKMSKGRQVVEWLLGCDKAAGLETGVAGTSNGTGEGEEDAGEEMEGVEKTGANGVHN